MLIKRISMLAILFLLVVGLIGCSSETSKPPVEGNENETSSDSTEGGELRIAYSAQPQTLDPQMTTANPTRDPARQIFETLVTLNSKYEVTPMLAESYEVSEDGKKITFKLRQGVKFHNGKEMKAEDVIASMEKWQQGSLAKANLGDSTWEALDDYTVVLHVEKPSFVLMYVLAEVGQFPAIMPKEVIEGAGPTGVTEYIGTGPFKFVEWKQDQYIHFEKFEDYQSVSAPADGLAGKKEALVDDLYFYFVPDDSTRVNGLISGEYDFAFLLPYDNVPQIENTPGLVSNVWDFGIQTAIFNKKRIFGDVKLRQAVNYALDKREILTAAFTDEKFFRLDPGFMMKDQVGWYTDAGKENYNPYDTEKAKQLLKEAGYNGEEVIILTSRDYAHHYNSAVITQQQLEAIGMNVKLDVYDWATLLERRGKPELWDIFYTAWPISATPNQYPFLESSAEWPGWTNNPEIDRLLEEITVQKTQEGAKKVYEELQSVLWEDLPVINVGVNLRVTGYSDKVEGYKEFVGPVFWNTKVSK
jgi:peptide/nickel transport system substrate-binding protein